MFLITVCPVLAAYGDGLYGSGFYGVDEGEEPEPPSSTTIGPRGICVNIFLIVLIFLVLAFFVVLNRCRRVY